VLDISCTKQVSVSSGGVCVKTIWEFHVLHTKTCQQCGLYISTSYCKLLNYLSHQVPGFVSNTKWRCKRMWVVGWAPALSEGKVEVTCIIIIIKQRWWFVQMWKLVFDESNGHAVAWFSNYNECARKQMFNWSNESCWARAYRKVWIRWKWRLRTIDIYCQNQYSKSLLRSVIGKVIWWYD